MSELIHLRLKRSPICMLERQKRTIRSLGFRRVNQVISVSDSPAVRGMIQSISFALEKLSSLPPAGYAWKGPRIEAGLAPKSTKKKVVTKKKTKKKKASSLKKASNKE